MTPPLVYTVILNYRNYHDTVECVRSVQATRYPNHRLVLVDNNSRNGSEEILRSTFPNVPVIQTGENRGYASGNNAGIRHAIEDGADYVLILNNDTLVRGDSIGTLVDYAHAHPEYGVVGPKLVTPGGEVDRNCARRRPEFGDYFWRVGIGALIRPENRWKKAHYYEGEYGFDGPRTVDLVSGACMLFRREVFETLGLLDERTFLFLEEFIVHEKLRETEFGTAILPAAIVVHKQGGSIGPHLAFRARLEGSKSLRYYLREYRRFGWAKRTFALLSVELHRLALMAKGGASRLLGGRGRR